jgi:putative metallohydrolase (TIGR04338 family)
MATNGLRPGQRRDNRRQRLYDAERVLRGLRVSAAARRHLTDSIRHSTDKMSVPGSINLVPMIYPSVASTQDYVDAVISTAWFRRRWGFRRIPVEHSKGRGSVAWSTGTIAISCSHRRSEAVILHEIAHRLTSPTAAHHGPEFAGILLTLVKHVMGAEHAKALRTSFREHKVRVTMAEVPAVDEDRRQRADATAKARGFKPRTTTRTPALPTPTPKVKHALTYEQCYAFGARSSTGDAPIRTQNAPGFDADAYMDGYLDESAGREKYHLRDCKAHHNGEGGCGVA